jgi:hypothetical protein
VGGVGGVGCAACTGSRLGAGLYTLSGMAEPKGIIERFEDMHKHTFVRVFFDDCPLWHDGSDAAALFAVLWHVEPLVFNGGWPSVYYNRHGWTVPIAARGYRLLGFHEAAERCELAARLVAQAEADHPGRDYKAEAWLSDTLMQTIRDEDWDRLDNGWFEITKGVFDAMEKYIEAHLLDKPV